MNYKPMQLSAGVGADTGAASVATALPNDANGTLARRVRVSVSVAAYVLPCLVGGAVTNATGTIVNPETPLDLFVGGVTHIAHLQVASAGRITITPINN